MEYYVGLDVSLKQTSICVVDQTGSVVREGVVDSDPEAISVYVRSNAPDAAITRRARAPFPYEAERLSERIAVLEQMLSVLRAELQIGSPNNRSSKIGLRRAALCVRRPIAGRYQTPAESGNRRASSRT
jgi:hypothetical protein